MTNVRLFWNSVLISLPSALLVAAGIFFWIDKVPEIEKAESDRVKAVYREAALAIAAFWCVPVSAPLAVKLVPFLFIGFFIYGPQALLGVATTQQATPRAAGVAGGFVGIFSYASTVLSGIGFGFIAQRWGWSAAYAAILVAAVTGGVVLTLMWRAQAEAAERT